MLKRYSFLLIVILILISFLPGCQNNKPLPNEQASPEADQPGSFFPLTKGSTWKYTGEGNEYASFTREVIFSEKNLAQIKENNGGTQIAAVYQVTDAAVIRVLYRGEAYDDINFLNNQFEENTIILKTPLQKGTTWQNQEAISEIIETNAKVKVAAGDYDNCLKIKTKYENSTIFEYYQKGVGLVKKEFVAGDTVVTSDLEEVKIK